VGHVHISLKLVTFVSKVRAAASTPAKERFRLSMGSDQTPEHSWEDTDDRSLDAVLRAVVVEMLMMAEARHRTSAEDHHKWLLKRRADAEEDLRREVAERERKARELLAKQAKERVDRLLSQAAALAQADTIRSYVAMVRSRRSEMDSSNADIEVWAAWALAEADRIDPVNGRTVERAIDDLRAAQSGLDNAPSDCSDHSDVAF